MLKKRLIGVVTIKNGWAVQSFGYNRYLPLGKPECIIENLDRWGVDEILVLCIDRSKHSFGPDFELLKKIACLGLKTPLIFGGGINSVEYGLEVIQLGADRICVDAIIHDELEIVRKLSEYLGAQAVIGSLPLSINSNDINWLDYRKNINTKISHESLATISHAVSEVLIIDWVHEGTKEAFDSRLISEFPLNDIPLLAFGGVSECQQMHLLLSLEKVAAVAVGNSLNYKEHSIQKLKENLTVTSLRQSNYESKYTLLSDV